MFPRGQRLDGRPTLLVRGDLDICGSISLEAELTLVESARPPVIVLDLRELGFIDLHGLDAILAANERARSQGRRIVCVLGVNGPVRRLFDLAGAADEIEILDRARHGDDSDDQAPAPGAA